MTAADEIRRLNTVADARAWFRANGMNLTSAEHMAFINRMDALTKLEAKNA
jgi:hypothetical protein